MRLTDHIRRNLDIQSVRMNNKTRLITIRDYTLGENTHATIDAVKAWNIVRNCAANDWPKEVNRDCLLSACDMVVTA